MDKAKFQVIYKKHLICMVLLFIFVLLLWYYLKSNRPPSIHFKDGTYYDYGVVNEGESITHQFVFENRGAKTLQIKKVETSCACTGAEAEKLILEPGEASGIKVSYNARPVLHKEILQVGIESNDPRKPFTVLTLTCRVHLKVFWYPKSVSFYLEHGTNAEHKEVRFLTDSTEKFEIEEIVTSSDRITAYWDKNDKDIKCKISPNPECPEGNWTEKVTLQTLVGNFKRNIEIPVHLMIQ